MLTLLQMLKCKDSGKIKVNSSNGLRMKNSSVVFHRKQQQYRDIFMSQIKLSIGICQIIIRNAIGQQGKYFVQAKY